MSQIAQLFVANDMFWQKFAPQYLYQNCFWPQIDIGTNLNPKLFELKYSTLIYKNDSENLKDPKENLMRFMQAIISLFSFIQADIFGIQQRYL